MVISDPKKFVAVFFGNFEENKLAKLRRHASRVHFARIHFGKTHFGKIPFGKIHLVWGPVEWVGPVVWVGDGTS